MRSTVRLHIVWLIVLFIPTILYSRTAYRYYRWSATKTLIIRREIYIVFNGESWNEYNKQIINKKTTTKDPYQQRYEEVLRQQYAIDIQNGNKYLALNKGRFLHYRNLALISLVLAVLTWLYNQIPLEKKEIRFRTFSSWPALFRDKAYRQILLGQKIKLADIKQLHIYPLTAKLKQEANFSQLKPFNRVLLTYLTQAGNTAVISVSLLFFPNFKNLIRKIIKRNPNVQLLFTGSDQQTYQLTIPEERENKPPEADQVAEDGSN